MAGEVLPYVQGESPKGSAAVYRRSYDSPATSRRWWPLHVRGVPWTSPTTPCADWLAKFHTSSEPIQALWIVAIAATVIGLAYFAKEIILAALHPHRHSGAAKRNPEPITARFAEELGGGRRLSGNVRAYGFRSRAFGAPRNDGIDATGQNILALPPKSDV